jgi:outer membrane protein assembly factor BamB
MLAGFICFRTKPYSNQANVNREIVTVRFRYIVNSALATSALVNFALVSVATLAISSSAQVSGQQTSEANWPQWRGPRENGVAPLAEPPVKWSATSNIRWKVRIPGEGTSTPVIWGDQVFVQAAYPASDPTAAPPKAAKGAKSIPTPTEAYRFVLICLDRDSGKTRWQKICREEVPHEGHHPTNAYASSSPLTDGKNVIAYFGSRGLHCFDMAGNLKWQKDFGKQRTKLNFGEGSTPALFGNTIVVTWDHEGEAFIVAIDKRTGDELWRQPRDEKTGWSTPLVVEHNGKPQVITTATGRIRSYDLATGKQIWEHEGLTTNAIPTPVTAGGVVFATSGFQGSKLFAIRLGASGDLTGSESILWSLNRDTPYVPSPLLSGNRLYFFKSNNAILSCLDIATGQPHYSAQRIEGLQSVYASPIAANGYVYLVGRDGTTVVIKDADTLEIVATNLLSDPTDASPAAVGNQLFLRSRENLYCLEEK